MDMTVLGIDISKKKFDVALLVDKKFWSKSYSNNKAGFEAFCLWLNSREISPHICMESTGIYGHALANFLFEKGYLVSMVNPARIKGFGKSELSRNKTDEADAKLIARFCLAMRPGAWQPEPEWQVELKQWVNHLDNLKELERMALNRQEVAIKSVQKAISKHLKALKIQIEEAKEKIEEFINKDIDLRKKRELLASIPGIGQVTTAHILAHVGDINRFKTAKKLAAFAGLNPCQRQSGTSIKGRTKLSKIGSSQFRKSLYMPALVAIRYNPTLKTFYEGLLARGKAKMVAIGAVMRRLLHIVYGVLKNQQEFSTKPNCNFFPINAI